MTPPDNTRTPHAADQTRARRTPRQRAQAVKAALDERGPGRFTVHTPAGVVAIERVEVIASKDGADVVEVHAGDPESGDPHFRVVNPPRYVPDPDGDIEINGQRFRDDPIAALAHVVALHGGRLKDPRRGR